MWMWERVVDRSQQDGRCKETPEHGKDRTGLLGETTANGRQFTILPLHIEALLTTNMDRTGQFIIIIVPFFVCQVLCKLALDETCRILASTGAQRLASTRFP